ncbi:MAG TPA: adenylate/guanylate cyclase domain-containing protein [Chloroflexia bacterium]|nr:adenylate/guanylate cyclase domain-containing protein [Chloroflexia bacterium]
MDLFRRATLLQIFSLISLIGVVVIGVVLGSLISNTIETQAIDRARDRLADVIRNGAGFRETVTSTAIIDLTPAQFATLHSPDHPAEYNWWSGQIFRTLAGLPVFMVKVWSPQATVVWSDRDIVGQRAPENETLQQALQGAVAVEFTNLNTPENAQDQPPTPLGEPAPGSAAPVTSPPLIEVYVPILRRGTFEQLGVIEVYEEAGDLTGEIQRAQGQAWGAIVVGLGLLYGALIGLVARASQTITRLQRLQELERYFSPAVARAIAAGDGAATSAVFRNRSGNLSQRLLTRGEISILFTDIRGFTRQSEVMDAEDVVEMLNAYMDVVTTAVFQHNGSIDKFLGDGVLAVFGAPLADPNHALDAVRAIQEIRAGLDTLNGLRQAAGQTPIIIGAAVTTGVAVTGNIGSDKQLSFTVTGDTVNLGSRLVGMAGAGEVLISARTYALMQHDAETGDSTGAWSVQGPLTLPVRGREEPATVYVLAPDAPPAAAPREAVAAARA